MKKEVILERVNIGTCHFLPAMLNCREKRLPDITARTQPDLTTPFIIFQPTL